MPQVKSHSASIYYEVHGDGPPLVLAHGAGGNTEARAQRQLALLLDAPRVDRAARQGGLELDVCVGGDLLGPPVAVARADE